MTRKLSVFGLVLGLLVAALFLRFPHEHLSTPSVVSEAAAITYNPATGPDLRPDELIVQPQPVVAVHAVGHSNMVPFWDGTENATPPMVAYNYVNANPYPSMVSYTVWNGKQTPAPIYTFSKWGSIGDCAEQFSSPVSAVVYNSMLLVVDRNNHRVKVSTLDGKSRCTFGKFGTEPGNFNLPSGIAEYNGNIYVADTANHRVQCFTPDGELLGVCNVPVIAPVGITFDRATGVMYLTDTSIHCITALNPITPMANAAAPVKTRRTRHNHNDLVVSNNK